LKPSLFSKLASAWETIRAKKELLVVGIIESSFKICLALFLFFWTPLLEETAQNFIHPGTIYVCFMISRLIGSEAFQVNYQMQILNENALKRLQIIHYILIIIYFSVSK